MHYVISRDKQSMSSVELGFGCFGILVCLVFQLFGFLTPTWFTLQNYITQANGGLFKLCHNDDCVVYISLKLEVSVDYTAIVGSQCLGTLLLLIALIVGLAGCSNLYQRGAIKNIAGLATGAGTLLIVGTMWFFVLFNVRNKSYFTLYNSFVGINLGYSFYLCAVSAGLTQVLAISLCIAVGNRERSAFTVGPVQKGMIITGTLHQEQQQIGQSYPGYSYYAGPPPYQQLNDVFPVFKELVKDPVP